MYNLHSRLRRPMLLLSIAVVVAVAFFTAISVATAADADKPTPAKSEKELKRLIEQLGSNQYYEREQASAELSKLGGAILATLKEATKHPDAEIRRRAELLVERLEAPILDQPIMGQQQALLKSFL
jgi:hypothetical protein